MIVNKSSSPIPNKKSWGKCNIFTNNHQNIELLFALNERVRIL